MTKKNGVNYSMQLSVQNRRKRVIERLESQLKLNHKPLFWFNEELKRNVQSPIETVALIEQDRNRINKELETLKKRI